MKRNKEYNENLEEIKLVHNLDTNAKLDTFIGKLEDIEGKNQVAYNMKIGDYLKVSF